MKKIFENIKFLLSFSKSERRGIVILLTIIFVILLYRLFYLDYIQNSTTLSSEEFSADIEKFLNSIDTSQSYNITENENLDFNNSEKSFALIQLNPFPFNPNKMTGELWKKLGLRDKQINMIEKYISKGGKFYKKEDFKKLYCISPEEYSVLEPFISIPKDSSIGNDKIVTSGTKKLIFEINSSDTLDLMEISGIGSTFAKRIIKYRDMLGGYVRKEQLLEVFGLDTMRYNLISSQLIVDNKNIKKIDINTVSINELKKHPYLDYYLAKSIITYRQKNGNFKSISELKKVPLIYDDVFEKISPYLVIN